MKKLENKVAFVYGDGSVGGAIAKAFAREGARVFPDFADALDEPANERLKCSESRVDLGTHELQRNLILVG